MPGNMGGWATGGTSLKVVSKDYLWQLPPTSESVSRLVNFTDAVVAIAITLLVLPLTEIEAPGPGESVWQVMRENSDTIWSFVLSFVITLAFWRRHHRMFDGLRSFDGPLLWLNGAWLLGIVFLQFPTNMLGHAGPDGGIITLYCLTLVTLALLNLLVWFYLRSHPALMPPERLVAGNQIVWGAATVVWLLLVAIVGIFAPESAMWLMLGLLALGWVELGIRRRQVSNATATTEDPPPAARS